MFGESDSGRRRPPSNGNHRFEATLGQCCTKGGFRVLDAAANLESGAHRRSLPPGSERASRGTCPTRESNGLSSRLSGLSRSRRERSGERNAARISLRWMRTARPRGDRSVRAASTTRAPRAAAAFAVTRPMPLETPVMTIVCSARAALSRTGRRTIDDRPHFPSDEGPGGRDAVPPLVTKRSLQRHLPTRGSAWQSR
jgi:hypothetical protein